MANIKTIKIGIKDSIELFITHWKYGHNYEDSTVLVDQANNIIAWFDRKTKNIDIIMTEIPTPGGFVIDNGKGIILDEHKKIKYESYDYNICRARYKEEKAKILKASGSIEGVWDEMLVGLREYNVNYFSNLRKEIDENFIN